MRRVVVEDADHTWLVMDEDEYKAFLMDLICPHFTEGCDPAAIAAYREHAEMVAEPFRVAHHIPQLKASSPKVQHLFIDYGITTATMGVMEEGWDEYAVACWSALLRKQSLGNN